MIKSTRQCNLEKPCGHCTTSVENLSVSYGANIAVSGISFEFHCGELTAVIGPNGAGKSTILKAILGQIKYSGSIRFTGAFHPRIGYVPQKISVQQDSPVSVKDFLLVSEGFRPAWLHVPSKKKNSILEILSLVSAEKLIDRKIGSLSGGEFQRVLLAASLNPTPDILLLDEPVSAVDAKGVEIFYEIICNLRRTLHLSILAVTHDIGSIAAHADKMILVNGKILAQGAPDFILKHNDFITAMGPGYTGTRKDEKGELHKVKGNGNLVRNN